MIVSGQIWCQAAAVHLVADALTQGWVQFLAKQQIQLGQLQSRHGGAQVDNGMFHVRERTLVGW